MNNIKAGGESLAETPRGQMSYIVVIKRVSDGVVRSCPQPFIWNEENDWSYWAFGNMSCDCNRELEFARAAGEDEPEVKCSDGRFLVLRFELPDGRVIAGTDAESEVKSHE